MHMKNWFCRCNFNARTEKDLRRHQIEIHKLNDDVFWERNAPDISWFLNDQEDRIMGKFVA